MNGLAQNNTMYGLHLARKRQQRNLNRKIVLGLIAFNAIVLIYGTVEIFF